MSNETVVQKIENPNNMPQIPLNKYFFNNLNSQKGKRLLKKKKINKMK